MAQSQTADAETVANHLRQFDAVDQARVLKDDHISIKVNDLINNGDVMTIRREHGWRMAGADESGLLFFKEIR